ncbi:hypothetical protein SCHIN_v1c11530 [Spiroplasma chinense]|uniref:GIY-YIG domain-containing protein n=1 Tax=Spiroplasma chinense TaxID=216932 RepID=A0A5B9Y6K2_9MOLU|nr:GIY-YIG nuclease family protein [Spiroplasma chinense]QEH62346.1 hypothetical protein SCHIN_v1c11530 [Spiroplasma chinense]
MNKDFEKQYKYIWKTKTSRDVKYKQTSSEYCTKFVTELEKTRQVYNVDTIKDLPEKISGVYLIYSFKKDKTLKFSYIGESINILQRWKTHIYNFKKENKESSKFRKKEKKLENLRFLVLSEIEDQNLRLKKETYYIYALRSKFTNTNTKLANRKMRCENGHGVKRTFLTYHKDKPYFEMYIYGTCRNKICDNKFLIN